MTAFNDEWDAAVNDQAIWSRRNRWQTHPNHTFIYLFAGTARCWSMWAVVDDFGSLAEVTP